ncbi:Ubiquitin-conjugating enzyme E2 36, partial [Zea mays]
MTAKCCSRCNNTSIVWGRLNTPLAWCAQICEMLQWGKKQKAPIMLCTCGCSSVRCSAHEHQSRCCFVRSYPTIS